jgi:hypothetical protein
LLAVAIITVGLIFFRPHGKFHNGMERILINGSLNALDTISNEIQFPP